jgi:hypothetical protein
VEGGAGHCAEMCAGNQGPLRDRLTEDNERLMRLAGCE